MRGFRLNSLPVRSYSPPISGRSESQSCVQGVQGGLFQISGASSPDDSLPWKSGFVEHPYGSGRPFYVDSPSMSDETSPVSPRICDTPALETSRGEDFFRQWSKPLYGPQFPKTFDQLNADQEERSSSSCTDEQRSSFFKNMATRSQRRIEDFEEQYPCKLNEGQEGKFWENAKIGIYPNRAIGAETRQEELSNNEKTGKVLPRFTQ